MAAKKTTKKTAKKAATKKLPRPPRVRAQSFRCPQCVYRTTSAASYHEHRREHVQAEVEEAKMAEAKARSSATSGSQSLVPTQNVSLVDLLAEIGVNNLEWQLLSRVLVEAEALAPGGTKVSFLTAEPLKSVAVERSRNAFIVWVDTSRIQAAWASARTKKQGESLGAPNPFTPAPNSDETTSESSSPPSSSPTSPPEPVRPVQPDSVGDPTSSASTDEVPEAYYQGWCAAKEGLPRTATIKTGEELLLWLAGHDKYEQVHGSSSTSPAPSGVAQSVQVNKDDPLTALSAVGAVRGLLFEHFWRTAGPTQTPVQTLHASGLVQRNADLVITRLREEILAGVPKQRDPREYFERFVEIHRPPFEDQAREDFAIAVRQVNRRHGLPFALVEAAPFQDAQEKNMNKPIEPPLNGAERGYSDGAVELYVDGVDYRVLADNQVLIADYHDDGSIQGWTTCHALTEDELLRLRERADLLRKGA